MEPDSWGTWKPPEVNGSPRVASDRPNEAPPFWGHPLVILLVGFALVIAAILLGYHFSDGAVFVPPAP